MVEGEVVPASAGALITAAQSGRTIVTVEAGLQDGKFRMALAPGTYDICAAVMSAAFPMTFPGVTVEPGKTTVIPCIDFSQSSGNAVLSGRISPGGTGTRVTLPYEGIERTSSNAAADGTYGFTGLSPGTYTMQVSAPDYARDAIEVAIADDARATQNIRLFYVSAVPGVDWTTEIICTKGMGFPPRTAANATIRKEMAKRAALVDAQRNLLKIIERIMLNPNQSLKSLLGDRKYAQRIQGFVQGCRVMAEHEQSNGTVEIEVELSLTGPGGLSRHITEQPSRS
jgi:hypothetical protein